MADEQGDSRPPEDAGRKGRTWPILIVALLMGVEGVGVFLLAKAISPNPVPALAAGAGEGEGSLAASASEEFAEIELAECRPSNKTSGRFITFHIRVSALVSAADLERAKGLVRDRRARLEDGVNTVIRRADVNHLNEPELKTLKRHLEHALGLVFDDDQLIKEVLIPQLHQSGPGV